MNLGYLLSTSASKFPRRTAAICGNARISYEELDRETTTYAKWFLEQGCRPGDCVAILWPNSIETVKLLFACFKAGLPAVPVSVSLSVPEITRLLQHANATTFVAHPNLVLEALEASRGCPLLRSVHTTAGGLDQRMPPDLLLVKEEDPALILYTSAMSPGPKGITHTHSTIGNAISPSGAGSARATEVVLIVAELSHMAAICGGLLQSIATGATAVLAPGFDAAVVLDLIERFACTSTTVLPSMAQSLLEEQEKRPRDVRSLREVVVVGDSLPSPLHLRFEACFKIPAREVYGMTEIAYITANEGSEIRRGSVGRAAAGVQIRIVDSEGYDVADGQTGEIIARGPGCFVGYWQDPQATAETLREGWLHSGDLGHRDRDGYLWFDGRKNETIVCDGQKISPHEVEQAIYAHPSVLEVVVVGQAMTASRERVVAYVSLRQGMMNIDERELRRFAAGRLDEHKVPERFVLLPSLPKGITGKIQRRALKEAVATAAA
jgi:long-chain acyl-CoA synthetase